jgi:type I restriction enzyme S subunit
MKPKIRLKGYSGDWSTHILSEIGFMTAGGTPSTFIDEYWNGEINWLQSGAIQNKTISTKSVVKKISEEGLTHSSAHLIKPNSVLIAITGATCANVGYLPFESSANQSVVSIETYNDFDPVFLFQYLLTQRNNILSYKGGSAQSGVSLGNLKKLSLKIPNDKAEQIALGKLFNSIDKLIEQSSKKVEVLKQTKLASLHSMIPQNGEKIPSVRFNTFNSEWKTCKLGEILTERHEASTITRELPQLSFTIADGVIRPEDRKSNQRDFLIKDKDNKRYLVTRVGDIIYNPANVVYGAIHRNALTDGVVSPIYRIFSTEQDSRFIECVVRRPSFISQLAMRTEGTVTKLKTLKPEAFLDMTVRIPTDIEEQIAIGEYFRNIDQQIKLQTLRLEKLNQIKSACLDSMFV